MRTQVACLMIVAALSATAAVADPSWSGFDSEPRVMLYVQKSLGSRDRASSARVFGLSLQREISSDGLGGLRRDSPHAVSVLDFRLSFQGKPSVLVSGLTLAATDRTKRAIWQSPWTYVILGVAAIGISCATDNWPCDDSYGNRGDSDRYTPSGGY